MLVTPAALKRAMSPFCRDASAAINTAKALDLMIPPTLLAVAVLE
jgi:hypothetical protein